MTLRPVRSSARSLASIHLKPRHGAAHRGGKAAAIFSCELLESLMGVDGDKPIQALWLIAEGTSEQRRAFFGDRVKVTAKDRLYAVEVLLERGFGKAPQSAAVTGHAGGPLVVEWMSDSDRA